MSYVKKHLLMEGDSDGGGGGWGGWGSAGYGNSLANGSYNSATGSWSLGSTAAPSTLPGYGESNYNNMAVDTGPDTSSIEYQSDFLRNMMNDPNTAWGSYDAPLKPLDAQTLQSWGNVTEAQTALSALPSSEGLFGNALNQQYNADGSEAGWTTSPLGQKVSKVGRTLMGLNPYGRVANMGIDAANGVPLSQIAANAIPGNAGALARMGADVANGATVGGTIGSRIGGALGSFGAGNFANNILGGGLPGALAGVFAGKEGGAEMSQVGRQVGDQVSGMVKASYNPSQNTGTDMGNTPSFWSKLGDSVFGAAPTTTGQVAQGNTPQSLPQQQSPLGSLVGGLGSLYLGNQAISGMNQQRDAIQQQQSAMQQQQSGMPTLESMYGSNSPYALQLRKELAAKDAKAGRNSQYGAREAQLQALLAEKGSQYAAQQAQINNYNNTSTLAQQKYLNDMNLQQNQIRAQQIGSLYDFGRTSGLNGAIGQGLGSLYNAAAPALYDMFGGGSSYSQPSSSYEEA